MTWSPKIFIETSAWRAYLKNAEGININKNNSYQLLEKLLALLILVNVLAVILESVSSLSAEYALVFMQLRQYSYAVFVLEYGIRIYCCVVSHSTQSKQLFATLRRIFSPIMVVDFLVISLFYLKIQLGFDLRLLRLFRVLYILEVLRNSAALHILQSIFVRERKTLLSLALIMIVLVIFEAAIIYVLENPVQPEVFSSIPEAMWWTLTTLTTVGYGDVVPITPLGKLFGVIVMFVGIGMFAVPTGILISAFYHEIKRKDFIATWDLVAQVPFFTNLSAAEIAQLADLLSLHLVRAEEVIFNSGDLADCMYFIVTGVVEIKKPGVVINIKGGDFFGEIGVLYNMPRTADATAKTETELLLLNSRDVELFMEYHPKLRQRIIAASEARG